MICSQCGHQNDDNMKFCTNCGNLLQVSEVPEAPVAEQVAPTPEPAPAYQPAPQPAPMPQYTAPQPTYQQPVYQPQYNQQQYPQPQYQYQQPTYQAPVYAQPQAEKSAGAGKPLGIVGMVLGILSLFLSFAALVIVSDSLYDESWIEAMVFSLIFSIVGLVLSIVGKSIASHRGCSNGPAIAGIICSALGLGFWVFIIFVGIAVTGSVRYY